MKVDTNVSFKNFLSKLIVNSIRETEELIDQIEIEENEDKKFKLITSLMGKLGYLISEEKEGNVEFEVDLEKLRKKYRKLQDDLLIKKYKK